MKPIPLTPHKFTDSTHLAYGKYLVIRKDGKCHLETWNGIGWAYNHSTIEYYYFPAIS